MALVIRRLSERVFDSSREKRLSVDETHATVRQERAILRLFRSHPGAELIPHRFALSARALRSGAEDRSDDALVAIDRKTAVWVSPNGEISPAEAPYPLCFGNPTTAHCIVAGFCRRSYACNE